MSEKLKASETSGTTFSPSPGRWTGSSTRKRILFPQTVLAIALLLAMLAAPILGDRHLILLSELPLFGLFFAVIVRAQRKEDTATDDDRRLLADPEDCQVCLVEIEVRVERRSSILTGTFRSAGRDRGMAWFEDDALFFNGHRTSFVLGGQDLLPREEWRIDYDAMRVAGRAIPLRVPTGRAYIVLRVLGSQPQPSAADAFALRLNGFLFRPSPSRVGRQWPPLEPWRP